VEICPDGKTTLRVRLIDSVGYMVEGAVGADEDGVPRMVTTPWFDHEIPMTEAAELGTKKVMEEHCSIGLVVTTDGSITDIPRSDYLSAESRAIADMRATNKPFLVVINSRNPGSAEAKAVQQRILQDFGIHAHIADCQAMDTEGICELLRKLLYAFPMSALHIHLPRWMDALEPEHPVKAALYDTLLRSAENIRVLAQAEDCLSPLGELDSVESAALRQIDLGTGIISCQLTFPEKLFYEILSSKAGITIENDAQLLNLLAELSKAKREYDKIADALASANATGYGIETPTSDEMTLQAPEVIRKGGAFGVKLKAGAPSIHMIRVDIDTQISPMVGDEKQSQDLIAYLSAESPEKLWESNIFGRSVYELVREGLTTKILQIPEDVRGKFRGTLTRIVNEGATGLICLIL
jgi:stage IV sporulation protein A